MDISDVGIAQTTERDAVAVQPSENGFEFVLAQLAKPTIIGLLFVPDGAIPMALVFVFMPPSSAPLCLIKVCVTPVPPEKSPAIVVSPIVPCLLDIVPGQQFSGRIDPLPFVVNVAAVGISPDVQ
jgi:hypothetical protein